MFANANLKNSVTHHKVIDIGVCLILLLYLPFAILGSNRVQAHFLV